MVAQSCLYFVNFHVVLLFFATILKFWKLLLKITLMRFKEEKYRKLYQRKSEIQPPKKHQIPLG